MRALAVLLLLVPGVAFADVSGTYQWTYGTVVLKQKGDDVTGTFGGDRTLACKLKDKKLSCTWKSTKEKGRLEVTEVTPGEFKGTWGLDDSATDNGEFEFHKKR